MENVKSFFRKKICNACEKKNEINVFYFYFSKTFCRKK